MNETQSAFSTFHLTGVRLGDALADAGCLGLRPALFGNFRDLTGLRHDFPLVLTNGHAGSPFVRTLSDIVDQVLTEIAPRGVDGERLRKHVLDIEHEIRSLAFGGSKGTLVELWELAKSNLLSKAHDERRDALSNSLDQARRALPIDGEVVDYKRETPAKVLTHAWAAVQENKTRRFWGQVNELVLKLTNILKADSMRAGEAFDAEALKRSVGSSFEVAFNFEAMSEILGTAFADGTLPEKRRRRIRAALSSLESQRFFAPVWKDAGKRRRKVVHSFVFDSCARALEAFQQRLPEMVGFIKAMSIAKLEIENRYKESTHDPFFRRFDERRLEPDDLALFPSSLVCLGDGLDDPAERAPLAEIICAGLPIKVLAQYDDILGDRSIASGYFSFGIQGSQLATLALGLDDAFVLQSSASALYRSRGSILDGLERTGPALFSIFSGVAGDTSQAAGNAPGAPPYLRAAAAMESRAFPDFTYDPAAGSDWISRLSVDENPQAEADWPIHRFSYEDEDLQKISQDIAFTFVDFAASDERYAGSFAVVPRAEWTDGMVPVNEFLDRDTGAVEGKVPYILMIDEDNVLHRAIVEDKLVNAAHRCRETWRGLREMGGIDNFHARELLAKEKEIWERQKEEEIAALGSRTGPPTEAPTVAPEEGIAAAVELAPEEAVKEEQATTDEPYIETPRCTTCNECTEINNRMFVYDENQQAYIADAEAGTYLELVQSAESCQVAIIHPGKPKNPSEPGLDKLILRAEPFN